MVAGLYIVIARGNMIKKLVGLSLFQTSVYLLYHLAGKILGGTAPIIDQAYTVYSNPLPHVLILTAIVVGVATLALGLALVVRIHEAYGTIEEDEIFEQGQRGMTMHVVPQLPALHGLSVPLLRRGCWSALVPPWSCRASAGSALAVSWRDRWSSRSCCCCRCWRHGVISYAIGGWAPPIGIEYRIDLLNAFVLVLVVRRRRCDHAVMPAAASPPKSMTTGRPGSTAMYLLCLTGLLGIAITGDAFNVFVFLEISSLATYVLIAHGPRPPRAAGRLPVSDHGHDRRDVLCHRRRPALSC